MKLRLAGLIAIGLLGPGMESAWAAPRLGAAMLSSDSLACVTFVGEQRRVGDQVYLILLTPPRVVDGWIAARLKEPCNQTAGAEGLSYVVRLRHAISDEPEMGVAIHDPSARVQYLDGEFIVHTEGASTPLRFRECTSTEGLHLTAWRGNRRTWHEYWYLGVDVEPSCTEEESKP